MKWLLLPVLLPNPALSQSSLSGFPALDATQNQQPVIASAGLPSPVILEARKDRVCLGWVGAKWVPKYWYICSCFYLGNRVPRGFTDCLSQLTCFLKQTFQQHLTCTEPLADHLTVTAELWLRSELSGATLGGCLHHPGLAVHTSTHGPGDLAGEEQGSR